ncbi:MAG: 3'-5' exonuclease [Spirochaetaceae bacterium]|nr:MAG: 3'-5' exonuclease [Spirochaetaceae bacterium]
MSDYQYIASAKDFTAWLDALPSGETLIAVDLEAEFNLHVYGEHFCLLQVFDGQRAAAVDPQTVPIELIKGFLEDPRFKKIVYDCSSDRLLLYRNHQILMGNLCDLRVAVRLLELPRQGLGSVLEDQLGIEPEQGKKRFQQYNWMQRPIHRQALAYAIDDVRHLFTLRDRLISQLQEKDLMEKFQQENAAIQAEAPQTDRKPGILRGSKVRFFKPGQMRLLENLHGMREETAKQLNLPPNSVFPNKDLLALAQGKIKATAVQRPRSVDHQSFAALVQQFLQAVKGR